jgi:hypothetical protein
LKSPAEISGAFFVIIPYEPCLKKGSNKISRKFLASANPVKTGKKEIIKEDGLLHLKRCHLLPRCYQQGVLFSLSVCFRPGLNFPIQNPVLKNPERCYIGHKSRSQILLLWRKNLITLSGHSHHEQDNPDNTALQPGACLYPCVFCHSDPISLVKRTPEWTVFHFTYGGTAFTDRLFFKLYFRLGKCLERSCGSLGHGFHC